MNGEKLSRVAFIPKSETGEQEEAEATETEADGIPMP